MNDNFIPSVIKSLKMIHRILFLLFFVSQSIWPYCHEFFCKNSTPSHEPRFDRDFLHSIDISICAGGAHESKNSNHETVSILNLYGIQDLYYTFLNYANNAATLQNLTDEQKVVVDNFLTLAAADTTKKIGKISCDGKFRYCATDITIIQNLINGFFLELIIPFSRVSVKDITSTHQSTTTDTHWTTFYNQLDTLLAAYNTSFNTYHHSLLGDVTILGGWTNNTETSEIFDFFDTSVRLGVIVPTSKQKDTTSAFAIAPGYNGHVGIPIIATTAWGLYDWLTIGAHAKGVYFLKDNSFQRIHTNKEETGYLTLQRTSTRESLGNIWNMGTFLKADHIIRGFSLQCNYNYTMQEKTELELFDTTLFSNTIVNTHEMLQKWSMHELQCALEYDFAQDGQKFNPHVKVFYAQTIKGSRCYLNKSGGFNTGLYIIINF